MKVNVTLADLDEKEIISNLMRLYRYNLSEFSDREQLDESGLFRLGKFFDRYWTDDDRHPFVIRVDGSVAEKGGPSLFSTQRHEGDRRRSRSIHLVVPIGISTASEFDSSCWRLRLLGLYPNLYGQTLQCSCYIRDLPLWWLRVLGQCLSAALLFYSFVPGKQGIPLVGEWHRYLAVFDSAELLESL